MAVERKISLDWRVQRGQILKGLYRAKKKIAGGAKEAAGKTINNEQLELKGKRRNAKSNLKESMSIRNKTRDIREAIAGEMSDALD